MGTKEAVFALGVLNAFAQKKKEKQYEQMVEKAAEATGADPNILKVMPPNQWGQYIRLQKDIEAKDEELKRKKKIQAGFEAMAEERQKGIKPSPREQARFGGDVVGGVGALGPAGAAIARPPQLAPGQQEIMNRLTSFRKGLDVGGPEMLDTMPKEMITGAFKGMVPEKPEKKGLPSALSTLLTSDTVSDDVKRTVADYLDIPLPAGALTKEKPTKGKPVKGLSGETGGRLAGIQQALEKVKEVSAAIINPATGTVNRALVFTMSTGKSGLMFSEGRTLRQKLNQALEAKLRIDTGAAATEVEFDRLLRTFLPRSTDSDETIRSKMESLIEFFEKANFILDPTGQFATVPVGGQAIRIKTTSPQDEDAELEQLLSEVLAR